MGRTIEDPSHISGWTVGWIGSPFVTTSDGCPVGNHFTFGVHYGPAMTAGQAVSARWTAAPGTELVGLSAIWNGYSGINPGQGQGTARLTVSTDEGALLTRDSPLSLGFGFGGGAPFSAQLRAAHWFEIRFTCLDQCATTADYPARGEVAMARFDVRDAAPPTGGVVGTATDAQSWAGTVHFGLNAGDIGGGVARVVVEADGVDALEVPLIADSKCSDIGPDPAVAEYAAAQPCPLRIDNGSLDIDSTRLPQGQHTIRMLLEDAAGNRTPIYGPVVRRIASDGAIGPGSDPALRGAANGDGASDQVRLSAHWGKRGQRTLLVSRFGRTHVVRGRLRTLDGAPIANATIDVVSKTTANNARELVKRGGPRTRSDGSWYLVLPRRASSRDLSFRYRSHVNDTVASATAGARLRVRAGVRLTIRPRVANRGQAIRFRGRLLGAPLPRGGKQIVLMARASRGGWVRFNVVRSGAGGRFHATYRFQQPGAARYRFRALSLAEAAYPYLAGGSNTVIVRKR
ncbi:MAG TPA: hypothetical protein VKB54_13975 [Solirubrobacteraceae bacterium]|nr:hypothetical protein [Solirubrobacteraceae bacterium]